MPYHYMASTYTNLVFYRNFFEEDSYPEILRLFFVVDEFLAVIASKNDNYSDEDLETWKRLFMKVKESIVTPCELMTIKHVNSGGGGGGIQEYHLSRSLDKLPYLGRNIPTIQ